MTAPNHILGGFVFTGVFGAMTNANLFERPELIGLTIFASILPDIDRPGSLISRIMPPLAKWLNRNYGHRTITHSLLALFTLTLLVALIQKGFTLPPPYPIIFFLAYFSHLLFDMMTVQGVPLFYPWKKNPCVIPGRPELRFRTSNIRSETSIFGFFLFSALFLQPLMQDGFWTTYNRLFGTMKHLHSEFSRSEDLLLVHYTYKEGTQDIKGSGYCIESPSSTKATILLDGAFLLLEESKMIIPEVIPEHTGKQFQIHTTTFFNVSADSINQMLWDQHLLEVQIEANQDAYFWLDDTRQEKKNIKAEYIADLRVEPIQTSTQLDSLQFSASPRIATLQQKIKLLQQTQQDRKKAIQDHQDRLDSLQLTFQDATDWYDKQNLQAQITQTKKWKAPHDPLPQIQQLQLQLQEARKADAIRYREAQQRIEEQNQAALPVATLFSGYLRWVEVN
ncbi:MAG: metal-dependent hydrolase [Bacteroidota bacterium]